MTRIKCCGMTRVEDALLAAQLGADAIGMVLTARSKRRVSVQQAQAIVRAMPPFVTTVVLFMDDDAGFVREAIDAIQPDLAQFHGAESDAWCAQFGRRYLKAIAMGEGRLHCHACNSIPAHPACCWMGMASAKPAAVARPSTGR
ncbi:N-(5'-phosphoribosyl)anthranilate isomerase [Dyella terrae]|nr:N-(5'-phosphoribosyl)anthranilate isomerase [Dyella terrae]